MTNTGTGAALKAKIAARLDGNVEAQHWDLDVVTDAPISLPTKAVYSYTWAKKRNRASQALSDGTIDSQIDKALKKGAPMASLDAAIRAEPRKWLTTLTARPLPGWHFAETCTETCDSCRGSGKETCGTCSGSGKVNCRTCGGSARVRQICGSCGGRGNHQRSRQVTHWNGQYNETRTEYYTENCWSCSGGYNYVTCAHCNSGKVRCGTCAGSGLVNCGDCGGRGKRLYRYDREILVNSSLTVTGARANHDGLRKTALSRWDAVLASEGVTFEQLACGDEGEGLAASSHISIPTTTANLRIHSAKGGAWALGGNAEISDGEPLLAQGLKLPEPKKESDWPATARHLAGTGLLRDAIARYGATKGALEARCAETAGALLAGQGWLLGEDGAKALAMTAAHGVGKLRGEAQKRVWMGAYALGGVIALVLAGLAIRTTLHVAHPGHEFLTLFGWGAALGGVLGVGATILARRNMIALANDLGVERGHLAPAPGKLALAIGGLVAGIPALTVALMTAAYFMSWPAEYRQIIDGQGVRSVEVSGGRAWTTTEAPMRTASKPDGEIIATLPAGTEVRIKSRWNDEWTWVDAAEGDGFVITRDLTSEPPR